MKAFVIPHAGFMYTKNCLIPIISQINDPSKHLGYKHIIHISTHHMPSNHILFMDTDRIGKGEFKNYSSFYKKFKNLEMDNTIEDSEHSLTNTIPFLNFIGLSQSHRDMAVFYVSNSTDRDELAEFVKTLNETYSDDNLYLFNSDLSHLNNGYPEKTHPSKFPFIEDELEEREGKWINRVLFKKNIAFESIEEIPACGAVILVLVSHLKFLGKGTLICRTNSQTKTNYMGPMSRKTPNNDKAVVSYASVSFPVIKESDSTKKMIGGNNETHELILKLQDFLLSRKFYKRISMPKVDRTKILDFDRTPVLHTIVFVSMYDTSTKNLLGCMGSRDGRSIEARVRDAMEKIVMLDPRFFRADFRSLQPSDLGFEITVIHMDQKIKFESEGEFIRALEKEKKNKSVDFSMYVKTLVNGEEFEAFFIPAVLYDKSLQISEIPVSLRQKALDGYLRASSKKDQDLNENISEFTNYFLIPSDCFVDINFLESKMGFGGQRRRVNLASLLLEPLSRILSDKRVLFFSLLIGIFIFVAFFL